MSWYSEARSKQAWIPESCHSRWMMSDISLGIVPSSMVSAMCASFRASSWGRVGMVGGRDRDGGPAPCLELPEVRSARCLRAHLARRISVLDVERGHSAHNGQDGLQRVAIDDGNELEALFQRVPVLVDDPAAGESRSQRLTVGRARTGPVRKPPPPSPRPPSWHGHSLHLLDDGALPGFTGTWKASPASEPRWSHLPQ